nr:hypothetical protein [Cellulosimicrobium sp. MM]
MRGPGVRRGGVGRGVLWGLAAAVPLAFLGVFFAWPVVTLVARGFVGDDGGLDLSGFAEVFSEPRTWRIVGLTLWQAVLGTALSLLLGVPGVRAVPVPVPRAAGRARARHGPFVLRPSSSASRSGPARAGRPARVPAARRDVRAIVVALVFFNYSVWCARSAGSGSTSTRAPSRRARPRRDAVARVPHRDAPGAHARDPSAASIVFLSARRRSASCSCSAASATGRSRRRSGSNTSSSTCAPRRCCRSCSSWSSRRRSGANRTRARRERP